MINKYRYINNNVYLLGVEITKLISLFLSSPSFSTIPPPPIVESQIKVMKMGCPQIARLLIEHGADPLIPDPSTGTCPAHDAIREGFVDTLLELVKGGASLYKPEDNFGQRPIDLASASVRERLIQLGILPH